MKVFVDADVFLAAILKEPDRGKIAKRLLNSGHQISTSLAVIMEIRTVLAKKQGEPQPRVSELLETIKSKLDIYIESLPELEIINQLQKRTLLYPMDCIHYSTASNNGMEFVSFDTELQENGAVSPSDIV